MSASIARVERSHSSLWVAFLPACAARLAYLVAERLSNGVIAEPYYVTTPYWHLATGLLRQGSLAEDGQLTTQFEPLYPMFIALGRLVFGDRGVWVQVLQAAAAAIGAVALYRLCLALTNRRHVAIICALLYACDPLLIRNGARGSEMWLLSIFLIAFCTAFVSVQEGRGGDRSAILAGAWLGLAVLTRASAFVMTILATVVLLGARRPRATAVLVVVSVAVWLPMAVRNHAVNGSFFPTRSGINLFIGNSRYAGDLAPTYPLDALLPYVDQVLAERRPDLQTGGGAADEHAIDIVLRRAAWEEIRRDPWGTLVLKARYVLYFFSPRVVPARLMAENSTVVFRDGRYIVENSVARSLLEETVFFVFRSLLLLAACRGVYLRRHQVCRRDVVLWCILLGTMLMSVVYFPDTRYGAPAEFVLLFYAGLAVEDALARRGRWQWKW